ncbi:Pyrroline-5-carboxylate reductase 1, mitochondrial [Exaiptasia diaphana]|nr:Pyrroline-5-carboxylate reductase 1, mitochondrial [Exaiptasia diaphana]
MSIVPSIGFIGAGKAAQVMAKGFLSAGVIKASEIIASSPHEEGLREFKVLGCHTTSDNKKVIKEATTVFLAIKAKVFPTVFNEISPSITRDHLISSIAAGVTLDYMQKALPGRSRIIRMMLNTPIEFREGVTAVSFGKFAREEDTTLIHKLMSSVALADGGVFAGLNRGQAMKLAAKTASGAAKMVLESGQHPGELKDDVCSAGGSTIYGINVLEERGFRSSLIKAVKAASDRAKEMGRTSIKGYTPEIK